MNFKFLSYNLNNGYCVLQSKPLKCFFFENLENKTFYQIFETFEGNILIIRRAIFKCLYENLENVGNFMQTFQFFQRL